MKKMSLILSTIFFSLSSYACPSIEGYFECSTGSRLNIKEINAIENGFSVSTDGNYIEYTNDNTFREIPATDSYKDAFYKSYCRADKFIVDFKATILYQDAVVGKQESTTEYKLKDGQMIITQKTKMRRIPLPTLVSHCQRL